MSYYNFYKEIDSRWYLDLPDWNGSKEDLELIWGADAMLEIFSDGGDSVTLYISKTPFENAEKIDFIKPGDVDGAENGEGSWYFMEYCNGIKYNIEMWLCNVTEYVFGEFPTTLYVAKIESL